jgi:hypothetical protein
MRKPLSGEGEMGIAEVGGNGYGKQGRKSDLK